VYVLVSFTCLPHPLHTHRKRKRERERERERNSAFLTILSFKGNRKIYNRTKESLDFIVVTSFCCFIVVTIDVIHLSNFKHHGFSVVWLPDP
jgi:hypothetical protein